MIITRLFQSTALAAGMLVSMTTGAHAGQLMAGAAKVDITPPADEFPYQAQHENAFVGVHDNIYTRALAFDDSDGHKALVISVEVTAIPTPDKIMAAIEQATGLPAADIMLVASHTHEVPLTFFHSPQPNATESREITRIKAAAVSAAKMALSSLQPATVAFIRTQAFVNTNNGEQAGRKYWYDPTGSSDKTFDILRVETLKGAPLALLLNYATHGEVMFRSVVKDGGYEVSGDLPGAVSRILETQSVSAPVVLFTSAAEGDQLPLFKSLQPDAELPATDEGAAGWGILDLQARRLAIAAIDALAGAPAGQSQVSLATNATVATCPGQHYTMDFKTHQVLDRVDTAPVSIPMTSLRLNNIVLAGIGADIASDIGRAIKSASPEPDTTLVTMLAGSVGYVLNDAAYAHPTHGVAGSPVKPGCATTALSAGLNDLLNTTK